MPSVLSERDLPEVFVAWVVRSLLTSHKMRSFKSSLLAGKNSIPCHQVCMLTVFSCTRWSSGHRTEHSIANAYVDVILNAQHFIYIENQVRRPQQHTGCMSLIFLSSSSLPRAASSTPLSTRSVPPSSREFAALTPTERSSRCGLSCRQSQRSLVISSQTMRSAPVPL